MKKYLFFFISLFSLLQLSAQSQILRLTPEQVEALFLKQNLELIAEKLNISLADAEIAQAKLWDNPELSISDINLWNTKTQREDLKEMETSRFAKNTQFSIELSQLIQTANKRGKLINREKASKEIAIQEFEEVLRGLKVELRKSISELQYQQSYKKVLDSQANSLSELTEAYKKQVSLGNIAKSELLRLQASLLEVENENNELQMEINEQQKTLKSLLSIEPNIIIEIEEVYTNHTNPENIPLASLLEQATENRPDVKAQRLQVKYHEKSLAYEKAQRVPDITVSANYDRYSGVWKDFVGFGVSFDLPFLNRNQGGIKAAKINKEQSQYLAEQQQNIAQHEVVEAYSNYTMVYNFYNKIKNNELLSEIDKMLNIYTKNLLNRNVSMLEYMDFLDTYKSNKETILSAQKKLDTSFEELQYTVGTEIK